ncbi:MAG: SDR family oxidoreductase [Candidatus Binataceae bacterium]|jgi:nucleoside-diphosphate-sugar epimerase
MARKKILIAGASGLVGYAAVRHFASLPDWDVVAVSRRIPDGIERAEFISVDLSDAKRCAQVFGRMTDVTHLAYAALFEKPDLIKGWRDRDQMETNLAMLRNLFEPLEAAATNLQHVSLLQGTKAYGAHLGPIAIPARERNPRHQHDNFYWLQEDFLRERQPGKRWSWTIQRPQIVIGDAIGGALNVIPALGVYAALRKEAGLPLAYPGGPSSIAEAVDADLLARSLEWSATTPACANQIFNITNGDVFTWREVWPVIADALGMKPGPPEPLSLKQEMPRHNAEWAAIVSKYNLNAPADLEAFVGKSFEFADSIFAYGAKEPPPPMVVSTIKARQAGFHDYIDTEDMFRKWFRIYQDRRLLPPI